MMFYRNFIVFLVSSLRAIPARVKFPMLGWLMNKSPYCGIQGKLPLRYIGVPLISSKLSAKDCKPLIEKIDRINSYSKYLSCWQVTLLKSIASSLTMLPKVPCCYLQTHPTMSPPLSLSFSQYISLSRLVLVLRKIEFLFLSLVYILGFSITIFVQKQRKCKRMCFLEDFQEHNQTPSNIFQNIFLDVIKHLKLFSFQKKLFSLENILHSKKNLY